MRTSEPVLRRMHAGSVIILAAIAGLDAAGCSERADKSANPPAKQSQQRPVPPAPDDIAASKAQQGNHPATPAIAPVQAAWEKGDKSAAVARFAETDWRARPLFAPESPLGLSEQQFQSLPAAERTAKLEETLAQIGTLKKLAAAVMQAGLDAAAKQDFDHARKYFTSLKQCGEALDGPDSLLVVKLVGRAMKKNADAELAELPK
jgi:hypothetical protein